MGAFLGAWLRSELFYRQLALGIVVAIAVLWGWSYIRMLWTPFLIGWSLAYVLNIPVSWAHQKLKLPRWISAGACVGSFVLVAVYAIAASLPLIQEQLMQLAVSLPEYAQLLSVKITPLMERFQHVVPFNHDWPQYVGNMGRELVMFLVMCVSNSMVLANFFTLIVLTPIVTFYSLKDWPVWMENGQRFITSSFWRGFAQAIDANLMAFIRGQAAVCCLLMICYTVAVAFIGLHGPWRLGVLIGLCAFVPYGAVVSGVISISLAAFHQMGAMAPLLEIVLMVGFLGAVEAYVLIPYFIGQRLGVHPVAVLFCFLMCVSTLGFSGIFIAMPLLAAMWGAWRFVYNTYCVKTD